jgi:hypothetical protein
VASPRRRYETREDKGKAVMRAVLLALDEQFPTEISSHKEDPAGDPTDPDYIRARVRDTESGLGRSVSDADLDYWVGVIGDHEGWSDYWRVRVIMGDNYEKLTSTQIEGIKRRVGGIAYIASMWALGIADQFQPTSRKGSAQGAGDTYVFGTSDDDIAEFNRMYDEMFPRGSE